MPSHGLRLEMPLKYGCNPTRAQIWLADVPPETRAKPGKKTEKDLLRHQLPAGLCAVAGKKLPFDASTLVNDMLVSKMSWETIGSFWMKLLGCEVVNGTHGPQVFFSWSFNVCFVLLPGELQLSIRGPVTSICWMRSMRGNWFTNCLKQLACQLIPQTSQQENASRCLQKPSQRGFFFGTRRNQLSFGLSYRIPIWPQKTSS